MTDANRADPVFGPFIKGLAYANTTIFANESAQRQVLVDAMQSILLEGETAENAIGVAAEKDQAILDRYYK